MKLLLASLIALSTLGLAACSEVTYEEVQGRIVEKRVNSYTIAAGDVSVPVEDYYLIVRPVSGGEDLWIPVTYSAYQSCEEDQRFSQTTEGEISCRNG